MKNFQNKNKIIKVSRQLRALARLAVIFWTFALILLLGVTAHLLIYGQPDGTLLCSSSDSSLMTVDTHKTGDVPPVYLSAMGSLQMLMAVLVSLNFFRFFDRLKNDQMFDVRTVACLHAAGQWWLRAWILDFVFVLFGNACLQAKMECSFAELFAPLMIIFVAWLLREAQSLQEDQALTV